MRILSFLALEANQTSEMAFPNDVNKCQQCFFASSHCNWLPAFPAFSFLSVLSALSVLSSHHFSRSNGASFTMFSCKIRSQRTSVCGKLVSMSSSVSSASSASVRFLSCRCSQMSALHTLMHAACHTPLQLFSFFLLGELCNALSSAPVKQLKCVIACRQQKLAVCFLFPVFLMFLDVFDVCAWYIAHRT